MSSTLLKLLVISLAGVLLLILLAFLVPIFPSADGEYERHWIWNQPTKHNPQVNKAITDQLQRSGGNEIQRRILDSLKNQPEVIPIEPVFLGSLGGSDCNFLGVLALFSLIAWVCFAGYVAAMYLMELKAEKDKAESRKKVLPIGVRRVRDPNRR
jgi:hypothetical protein